MQPVFDDAGWSNGPAQLGFGDGDEVTVLRQRFPGAPEPGYLVTAYFRRAFAVPSPGDVTNLVLDLLRDNGGIVYLNGTEIFRSNMPGGPVTPSAYEFNGGGPLAWAEGWRSVGPALNIIFMTGLDAGGAAMLRRLRVTSRQEPF